MAVTNYYSTNGQVRSESGSNGYLWYARDNIGSVAATFDTTGAVKDTYAYRAYGTVASSSGTGALARRMKWVGSWGYSYIDQENAGAIYYVRARHYSASQGMWTTRDPLWPMGPNLHYLGSAEGNDPNSPVTFNDPSGLQARGRAPRERPTPGHEIPPDFIGPRIPSKYPHYEKRPTCNEVLSNTRLYKEPSIPKGESYLANCCYLRKLAFIGDPIALRTWIFKLMQLGGDMDYKNFKDGKKYDEGGNYNYGYALRCAGLKLDEVLGQAGNYKTFIQGRKGLGRIDVWPYGNEENKQLAIMWGWCTAERDFDKIKRLCNLGYSCNNESLSFD